MIAAHRASWIIHFGPIPKEKPYVLHDCPGGDNRRCVNPAHLWIGTPLDNVRDATEKGTLGPGELHGCARLTTEDIVKIRRIRLDTGAMFKEIAAQFGITKAHARNICAKIAWSHIY